MYDSEDIMHGILFCWKVAVEAMSPMKMFNSYAEHMKNFSIKLMVPSSDYYKLTQPLRGSETQ